MNSNLKARRLGKNNNNNNEYKYVPPSAELISSNLNSVFNASLDFGWLIPNRAHMHLSIHRILNHWKTQMNAVMNTILLNGVF